MCFVRLCLPGFSLHLPVSRVHHLLGIEQTGYTALSTCEAEYMALAEVLKEGIWLSRVLKDLGEPQGRFTAFCDNQGAIALKDEVGKDMLLEAQRDRMWLRKAWKRLKGLLVMSNMFSVTGNSPFNPFPLSLASLLPRFCLVFASFFSIAPLLLA
jgi:hypothetical protein